MLYQRGYRSCIDGEALPDVPVLVLVDASVAVLIIYLEKREEFLQQSDPAGVPSQQCSTAWGVWY